MSETKQPDVIQLKKISCKTVLDGKSLIGKVTEENPTFKIMTIFGTVTGSKNKSHPEYGESTGLKGIFKAIRKSDGTQFYANTAWLPDIIIDAIVPVLAMNDGDGSIDFAYDIEIQFDESAARGYVYVCKPLIKQAKDPLAALEQRLSDKLGLPAPPSDDTPKKDDEPKDGKKKK